MNNIDMQKLASDVACYIADTQDVIEGLKAENASLRQAQKTASAATSAVDQDAVNNMVDNMVEAGHIKEAERDVAAQRFADPNALVSFMDKLAKQTIHNRQQRPAGPRSLGQSSPGGKPAVIARKADGEGEADAHFKQLAQNLGARSR